MYALQLTIPFVFGRNNKVKPLIQGFIGIRTDINIQAVLLLRKRLNMTKIY